ncbi:hypothetical protein KKD49_11555, partial [Myxococcota bacterium]|nr:hypothetical protein [Myxococcota bacterium]
MRVESEPANYIVKKSLSFPPFVAPPQAAQQKGERRGVRVSDPRVETLRYTEAFCERGISDVLQL